MDGRSATPEAGERLPDTTATDVQSTSQATEPETLSRTIPAAPLTAGPRSAIPSSETTKKGDGATMASTNPKATTGVNDPGTPTGGTPGGVTTGSKGSGKTTNWALGGVAAVALIAAIWGWSGTPAIPRWRRF